MKRYISSILIVLMLASCNYLDIVPDNVATIDNAFTDKFNAEKYLFTCYSYLPKMGSINENPALLGSDEVSKAPYHLNHPGIQVALGYQSAVNPEFNYWEGRNGGRPLYVGIRDCNIFLDRIDGVEDMTAYEKAKWKAEVKFIKAYLHFYLLRMYGPIHIIRENREVSEALESIKLERQPVDEVFDYVVELLDEAIQDLPPVNENDALDHGRITSTIAAAVKAKVLVTAASPLFNGESGFQIQNNDGENLFPESAADKAQKWDEALAACEEAVNLAEANGFSLFQKDDFEEKGEVSDSTKMKVILGYRVSKIENNKEVIWPHTNSLVSGLQGDAMPKYFSSAGTYQANANYGVPHKISLMYYTENGVPVEEDKDWQEMNPNQLLPTDEEHQYFMKLGRKTALRNFNRELRFYSDLLFDGALVYGHQRTFSNDMNQNLDYVDHLASGHSAAGHASKLCPFGYWPQKMVHIESGGYLNLFRTTPYAFPALRLADLYLLYAEALLETDNLAESKTWINKVRERAGLLPVDEAWANHSVYPNKPSGKEGLREILRRERLIEMAFEGSRFWDIRRWLEAEQRINNVPVEGWRPLESEYEKYYVPQTVYSNPSFGTKNYFFPISEQELTKNPNLVQNYAW